MATCAAVAPMSEFGRRSIAPPATEVRDEPDYTSRIVDRRSGRRRWAGGWFLSTAWAAWPEEVFLSECLSAHHARQQDYRCRCPLGDGTRRAHGAAYDPCRRTG